MSLYVSSDGISADAYSVTMNAAMTRMFTILPLYFMCGIMESMCGVLRGMGKSTMTMIFSLVGACLLRILWIETVFKFLIHSPFGIFISYPVSWFLVILIDVIYFIFIYRRLTRESHVEAYVDRLKKRKV